MGYYSDPGGYSGGSEPKRLRKGRFSKVILMVVVMTVLCYTVCVLAVSLCGGVVPDSLTYCFFGFFGTEVLSLVTIRVKKMQREVDTDADREDTDGGLRGGVPERDGTFGDEADAGENSAEADPADDGLQAGDGV